MKTSSKIHCDRLRITFAVPNDLAKADIQVRLPNDGTGELKGRNFYGFNHPVGNAIMFVRPWGPKDSPIASHLTLDGNPSKIGDDCGLCDRRPPFKAITRLCIDSCKSLDIPYDKAAEEAILRGEGTLSRMHLTGHFYVGAHIDEVLKAIKLDLKMQRFKTSSERDGGTVYYGRENGKESHYWAVAFYDKYRELLKHRPLGLTYEEYHRLLALAKGVLRVELRLNHKLLPRLHLRTPYAWREVDVKELFFRYLRKLGLNFEVKVDLSSAEKSMFTYSQRNYLLMWTKGVDLRDHTSLRTHQKLVKLFKDKLQVNVARRYCPPHDEQVNLRVLFSPKNLLAASYWQRDT